jgi:hypothetical protein
VEYYTLEDLRRALNDLGYPTEPVRDDGRYTVEELQAVFMQAALQARKNRVFEAHTR